MTAACVLVVCVVGVLARAAYRRARRRASRTLPASFGDELRLHKLACLREPEARVDLELRLLLGVGASGDRDRRRSGAFAGFLRATRHRLAPTASVATGTGTGARRS